MAVATTGTGGGTSCSAGYYLSGSACVAIVAYSSSTTYSTGQVFTWSGATVTVTGTGVGISSTTVIGCNAPDTVVWQGGTNNIQIWATCNAGATTAFLTGTMIYPSNTAPTTGQEAWMGAYYQWGNNGDLTTASTSSTQVNASGNAASTYSSTTAFITTSSLPYDWTSSQNSNLWGNTTNTSVARQGPCISGYHVPSAGTTDTTTDFGMLYTILNATSVFGSCNQSFVFDRLACTLKMPYSGDRHYMTANYQSQGGITNYWSSSPSGTYAYDITFSGGSSSVADVTQRGTGEPVRCLRN